MKSKKLNALAKWLKKSGTTQAGLASHITVIRGWPCTQSMVSRWATGSYRPSRYSMRAIEHATRGAVTARKMGVG